MATGSAQLDIDHNIQKQRLNDKGEPLSEAIITSLGAQPKEVVNVPESRPGCPSCYGAGNVLIEKPFFIGTLSLLFSNHLDVEQNDECCHSCNDVRNAYARRGWSMSNINNVAQCINEKEGERKQYLDGEGCRFYGFILVIVSSFFSYPFLHSHCNRFKKYKETFISPLGRGTFFLLFSFL